MIVPGTVNLERKMEKSEKGKKLSRKERILVCAEFACVKLLKLGSDLMSLPVTQVSNQEKSDDHYDRQEQNRAQKIKIPAELKNLEK